MKNKVKKSLGRRIAAVLMCVLTVVAVIADVLAFNVYASALDKAFPAVTKNNSAIEDARSNALAVAQELEEEGAVLLENNGALPLSENDMKINLLGTASYNPVYGGTGSGGSSYLENRTDFVKAFKNAGFEVNDKLLDMYTADNGEKEGNTFQVDFSIPEYAATQELANAMGQDFRYTGDCAFEALKDYSNTAVIVLSRKGGEGNDLPITMEKYSSYEPDQSKHYLELNSAEESLIEQAKLTFNKVIILINTGNAMELGFLENAEEFGADSAGDVDAAIWMGDPGDVGTIGIARILKGEVNPSGKLADIYPYAVETIPSYYNFDSYEYTNSKESFADFDSHLAYLVEYQEGIYVGYRYYETRTDYSYTTREGEELSGLTYEDMVQYPFGYGLSYSNFDWKVSDVTSEESIDENSEITVTVDVKNMGDVAGKDVVELYYTAPYYADKSHIQKSEVVLGGYAKTNIIEPGQTASVTITLRAEDMASYDDQKYYSKTGSYVLEKGDYTISLRSDSHNVKNDLNYKYVVDKSIIYADEANSTNVEIGAKYLGTRTSDSETSVNQFEDASGDVVYMNRDTWNIVEGSDKEATAEQLEAFKTALNLDESYINESDELPTWGANNGLTIKDLEGKDYNDPKWNELLDQLTLNDVNSMLAQNGWGSAAANSVGKPQIYDMDGPAALSYVFDAFMGTTTYKTVSYPCEVITASSWNTEMAQKFGDAISKEGEAWAISGWYAPGANIHRNPFSGRNFEYYSEDPLLSGITAANVVAKAQENGMYCYMKHYALNERETNRHVGLCTWSNEQAMREIYLKPFEKAVKEGNLTAMMSSYNNIGTTWAGGSKALLTEVLRDEWGFVGSILTDNNEEHGFMDPEVAIVAGGTALLYNGMNGPKSLDRLTANASGQVLLREAAHQYLYTIANSYAIHIEHPAPAWRMPAMVGSVIVYVLCTTGFIALYATRKRKEITK